MGGDSSAYAALGLKPGAEWSAVERAYRSLIKQHHPDRAGGDAARASEINRAYRDLRARFTERDALEFNDTPAYDRRRSRAVLIPAGVALLALAASASLFRGGTWPKPVLPIAGAPGPSQAASEAINQPLHLDLIDAAVAQALSMSRSSDEMAMAAASRDCHHRLRTSPAIALLDRCAAFDLAVVLLEDRDPLRDEGPFSELSVTGRLWSGASPLSSDSLAIDGRLNRIRLAVEMRLAALRQPAAEAEAKTP
jgi:hypothetical protein